MVTEYAQGGRRMANNEWDEMSIKLLTVRDVAEYVNVPVGTVFRWNSLGTGPRRMRLGKHVRYRQADVDAWLDSQVQDASWR